MKKLVCYTEISRRKGLMLRRALCKRLAAFNVRCNKIGTRCALVILQDFMTMERKQKTDPFSEQINITENFEVEYWANKLGIMPRVLREIVKTTGNHIRDVQKYLNK